MNSKCPCCNATLMFLNKGTAECFKCPFTCAQKDLPRIAAAMDYATKTMCWFGIPNGESYWEEESRAEDSVEAAKKHVLEVFGGK